MAIENRTKNVYQRLQDARAQLVTLKLKKTGRNDYSKFNYYELGDFLPHVNKINNEVGLYTHFGIDEKRATLKVFNVDKPEEFVTFHSPIAEVEIGITKDGKGGAQPIQNLGGKHTYMRRYLMMMAYEISEGDPIDAKDQSKNENGQLDEKSVKKIEETKTLQELAEVCRVIKEQKGPKYQKSLMTYYTKKKGELENENS